MPRFGSLRSYEQLDVLAQRYSCLPSDLLHTSYQDYCMNEACAIAGEARDRSLIERTQDSPPPALPPRRVGGLLVGSFSKD